MPAGALPMPVRWPTTPFRPLNLRWCGAPAQSARDKALRLDAPAGSDVSTSQSLPEPCWR